MSIVGIARESQLQRLQSWSHRKLLRWSATLTHSAVTLYERALDAEQLRAQLGGRLHRWVEGGHSLRDAWSHASALTGAVRRRTAASPPELERTRTAVAPAFVCDRALVDSMLL
jgi:hypothetical protein